MQAPFHDYDRWPTAGRKTNQSLPEAATTKRGKNMWQPLIGWKGSRNAKWIVVVVKTLWIQCCRDGKVVVQCNVTESTYNTITTSFSYVQVLQLFKVLQGFRRNFCQVIVIEPTKTKVVISSYHSSSGTLLSRVCSCLKRIASSRRWIGIKNVTEIGSS